jgi:hypothetical protein
MDERLEVMDDAGFVDEMSMEPMAGETLVGSPQRRHGLMDVLQPATPPQPKNARIVRRFDLEAAKNDPKPQGGGEPEGERAARSCKSNREFSRTREELRALRNRSLAAAAGFV